MSTLIISRVLVDGNGDEYGFQLAVDPSTFTIKSLTERLYTLGTANFIPHFRQRFPQVATSFAKIEAVYSSLTDDMPISSLLESDESLDL